MTETVLITGANRGIGLALAKRFADGGFRVLAACRNPAAFANDNPHITPVGLDVTSAESVMELAAELQDETISILVNNAGVTDKESSLGDMNYDKWIEAFAVNAVAPFRVAEAFLPQLKKAKTPKIITVTSMMGSLLRSADGYHAYRTSKAAANKMMQLLALDLEKDGIIACPVHPGWVKTDMGGLRAEITPEDSADGLFTLITGLKQEDSGRFWQWNGEEHPW